MTALILTASITLAILDGTRTREQMQAEIKRVYPDDRHYFSEFKLGNQTVLLVMLVDQEDGAIETCAYFEHKIHDPLNRPEFVAARDAMMRAYMADMFGVTTVQTMMSAPVVHEDGTVEK